MKNTVLLLTNHTDDSTNSVITNLKKLGQRFYLLAQEYVDKDFELRITIVGEKIFTCAICSQEIEQTKIDWRNNNLENIKHGPYELPPDIKAKIFALMRRWHLSYGAIDMIVTPKGEYVFLEINPGGQWLWIEEMTGMPISQALAELLANPPLG